MLPLKSAALCVTLTGIFFSSDLHLWFICLPICHFARGKGGGGPVEGYINGPQKKHTYHWPPTVAEHRRDWTYCATGFNLPWEDLQSLQDDESGNHSVGRRNSRDNISCHGWNKQINQWAPAVEVHLKEVDIEIQASCTTRATTHTWHQSDSSCSC